MFQNTTGANQAFHIFLHPISERWAVGLAAPRIVLQCWFDGAFRRSAGEGGFGVSLQLLGMSGKRIVFRHTIYEASCLCPASDSFQAEWAGASEAISCIAKLYVQVLENIPFGNLDRSPLIQSTEGEVS